MSTLAKIVTSLEVYHVVPVSNVPIDEYMTKKKTSSLLCFPLTPFHKISKNDLSVTPKVLL